MSKSHFYEKNRKENIQTNELLTQKLEAKFPDKKPACTKMLTERLVSSRNIEQLEGYNASTVDVESLVDSQELRGVAAATDSESSPLVTRLFVEKDIPLQVLLQLDSKSLQALELACSHFRQFIVREKVWEKKFEAGNPSYLDKTMDIDKSMKIQNLLSQKTNYSYQNYKKVVVKLRNLDDNLKTGKCTKIKSASIITENDEDFQSEVYAMNCAHWLVDQCDEEGTQQMKVIDFDSGKEVVIEEEKHIVHADSLPNHLTLSKSKFGIIALLLCQCGTNEEGIVEIFEYEESKDKFNLALSLELSSAQVGDYVNRLKFISSDRLLLLGTTGQDAWVSTLILKDNRLKLLGTKICTNAIDPESGCLCGPKGFQHDEYLFMIKGSNHDIATVYDLKTSNNPGKLSGSVIGAMWEKRVITSVNNPGIYCSALQLSFPNVFVGRSDGRCDIFDVLYDQHIRRFKSDLLFIVSSKVSGHNLRSNSCKTKLCLVMYVLNLLLTYLSNRKQRDKSAFIN